MECPTCGQMCASEKGMKQHHTRSHGVSLNTVEIHCATCDTPITKNKNDIKNVTNSFCSKTCESAWRSERYSGDGHPNKKDKVILTCSFCGDSYEEYPYRAEDSKFCSTECFGLNKTNDGTTDVSCEWCDTTFRKWNIDINRSEHNFCSKRCYGQWTSVHNTGQNHPNWAGGANLYEAIRENLSDMSWSRVAELHRQNSCYKCGKTGESLHEHHIVPVMYGGVNSEELLMTLCASCHRTVESYTMTMLDTNIIEAV